MNAEKQVCGHQECNCTVEAGQDYCSEQCRAATEQDGQMEDEMQTGCPCGHPACDES